MVPLNVSDNLNFKGKTLHLETQFRPGDDQAALTLYEGGRILFKAPVELPADVEDQEIKNYISRKHKESFGILAFLIEIEEKVISMRHGQSLVCLGNQYSTWGLHSEAAEIYRIAAEIEEVAEEARLNLADVLIRSGHSDQARLVLKPLIESGSTQPVCWMYWGRVLFEEGEFNSAGIQFKYAEKLGIGHLENALYLALICMQLQGDRLNPHKAPAESELQECMHHFANAIKKSRILTRTVIEPVLQHLNTGDLKSAVSVTADLIKSLKPEPDLAFHDLFYLRFLYDSQGRDPRHIAQYIEYMETLTAQYPDNPNLRRYLGTGYVIQCREFYQKALDEFQTADTLSNGAEPYHTQAESANQLGEAFFRFIKGLFL